MNNMRCFIPVAGLLLAPLVPAAVHAAGQGQVSCESIGTIKEDEKAKEYCLYYEEYVKHSKAALRPAYQACLGYSKFVVKTLKEICDYYPQAEKLESKDREIIAELLKSTRQSGTLTDEMKILAARRMFGDRYWRKFFETIRAHEALYQRYHSALHKLSDADAPHLLKSEVQGCGTAGEPFSIALFGIAGDALQQGDRTYKALRSILKDIIYDNVMLKQAMREQELKLHTSSAGMGEALSVAGTKEKSKVVPHLPGEKVPTATEKMIEAGAIGYAAERASHATMGHAKIPGVKNPVGGSAFVAATVVDVGLHWVKHGHVDSVSVVFTGMRLFVAGVSAVTAAPSGSTSLWLGVGIEAGLGVLEAKTRKLIQGAYIPQADRYLRYWQNKDPRDNSGPMGHGGNSFLQSVRLSSTAAASNFHNRTWIRNHTNPMRPGEMVNTNPAFGTSNFNCP